MQHSNEIAAVIGGHRLFAALDEATRRDVAERAELVHVRAGDALFRTGDQPPSSWLVKAGRIELQRDDGTLVAVAGPGDAVGEVGALADRPQPVNAVVVRDSQLVRIPNGDLLSLAGRNRSFASALLHYVGETLSAADAFTPPPAHHRSLFAVAGLVPGLPIVELARRLGDELARAGTVAVLTRDRAGADDDAFDDALDAVERSHDRVVLVDDGAGGAAWSAFCRREADVVLGAVGDAPPRLDVHRDAYARDLMLLFTDGAAAPADRHQWLDRLAPSSWAHVPGLNQPAIERLARRLAGTSLGVVLSGGGARGMSHIGVLMAVHDAGLTIGRVGGTSIGAFVGALYAKGLSPSEIIDAVKDEIIGRKPFNDFRIPRISLSKGKRARAMIDRLFGEQHIEDFTLDFFCVTADLLSGEAVVHRRGDALTTVGASMSIPGWAPPIRTADRILVDGGLLDNFPVAVMVATGEGPVLAVDAMGMSRPPERVPSHHLRRHAGRGPAPPNIVDTLTSATTLGSRHRADLSAAAATAIVRPTVGKTGLVAFEKIDELVEIGRRDAAEVLATGVFSA